MWTCPSCEREFRSRDQYHVCVQQDPYELFDGRPEHLMLAFDTLVNQLLGWQPGQMTATLKAVLLKTNLRTWLVIRPARQWIDLTFNHPDELESPYIKKISPFGKRFAHKVRIQHEDEVTPELLALLRMAYEHHAAPKPSSAKT